MMVRNKNNEISQETQDEAMQIAKKTQKPGQSKEQTRLIALGIQKGIAEYKKSAKIKLREIDKAKKKRQKTAPTTTNDITEKTPHTEPKKKAILPWSLLFISWVGFVAYFVSYS